MEKEIYQIPVTEVIQFTTCVSLLGLSISKGEGPGTGTVEIESKQNLWDEDDDLDALLNYNIWE